MGNSTSTDIHGRYAHCATNTSAQNNKISTPAKEAAFLDPRSPGATRTPVPTNPGGTNNKQYTPLRKAVLLDPRSPGNNRTPVLKKPVFLDPRSPGNKRTPVPKNAIDKENNVMSHPTAPVENVGCSPANDRAPIPTKGSSIEKKTFILEPKNARVSQKPLSEANCL